MQSPKSTAYNSNTWRLWHGFNHFIGGGTFLLGSLLLFPIFSNYLDAAQISGWLYTIGSATFLLANITQWLHYVDKNCRFLVLAINYFLSVCGSFLYLISSIYFIPEIGRYDQGMLLFLWGSALIGISQALKIISTFIRNLLQKDKSWKQCYSQDPSAFWVDFFAVLAGLMYFWGTIVFEKTVINPDVTEWGALLYTLGGLFFVSSAMYIQKRYFWEKSQSKNYQETDNSVVSSQI